MYVYCLCTMNIYKAFEKNCIKLCTHKKRSPCQCCPHAFIVLQYIYSQVRMMSLFLRVSLSPSLSFFLALPHSLTPSLATLFPSLSLSFSLVLSRARALSSSLSLSLSLFSVFLSFLAGSRCRVPAGTSSACPSFPYSVLTAPPSLGVLDLRYW